MPEDIIMRGKTEPGASEVLNFSGHTPGYAYQLVDFDIYPTTTIGSLGGELVASLNAGKTADDPLSPDFDDPGLIANVMLGIRTDIQNGSFVSHKVINDLFYITQDLHLIVNDALAGGSSPQAVNWQCKFRKVKLSTSAEAVANFNQFTIYDGE